MYSRSLVEYMYDASGPKPYKCGYCRSPDTSLTQGLLGYRMTCRDYQDLVDRGFQRSGRYVYRADMKKTCCPQYVIRMDVTEFTVTKSQRRAIKRFNEYLLYDKRYDDRKTPVPMEEEDGPLGQSADVRRQESPLGDKVRENTVMDTSTSTSQQPLGDNLLTAENQISEAEAKAKTDCLSENATQQGGKSKPERLKKVVRPGVGADPTKPPCRKAKLVRQERKAKKLAAKQQQQMDTSTENTSMTASKVEEKEGQKSKASSVDKKDGTTGARSVSESKQQLQNDKKVTSLSRKFTQDLKELLALPNPADCKHKFETRLVQLKSNSGLFLETYDESYAVFKKFQMIVHREKEEDSQERHFEDFLVQTPLENEQEGCESMPCMFGTYHQQYLLDGKIFAVGVIDVLPRGILCEYLYYDPDYRFIAPGVYTALHEIAFTQELFQLNPEMQYYYMGFYVQSCPKMNYKSRYNAGYLLCPETYKYIPIAKCVPKLKASPYTRLAENDLPNAKEGCTDNELDTVPIYSNMELLSFGAYRLEHGHSSVPLVKEYIDIVGLEIAKRMSLFIRRRIFM